MKKTLKEFIEGVVKKYPQETFHLAIKLIDLEAIEQYLNLSFGVELDIRIKPIKPKEGRFYGKGVIGKLFKR